MTQSDANRSELDRPTQSGTRSVPQSSPPLSSVSGELNSAHLEKLEWFRQHFRPHFNLLVFEPIDRLVPSQDAIIGFIVMACAIDYLAGFWWGISTKGSSRRAYTGFVQKYFPADLYDADAVWDSLRNGLVHMFTIKGKKYALTHNEPLFHLTKDSSGQIVLNAANFRDDLKVAKDRYFDDVESDPDLLEKLTERYIRDGFLYVGELEITEVIE